MRKSSIYVLTGCMAGLLVACDPIEERDKLTNSYNPDDIKLVATQATPGGNNITVRMETKGVTGQWDYNIGTSLDNSVSFIYPIVGKSTITYRVATPYLEGGSIDKKRIVTKTVEVQVDKIDHPINAYYSALTGSNLKGKTWVFDGAPKDKRLWYYMSPANDPSAWATAWWNAGGECCPPEDVGGKMVFDLDGGANYSYYAKMNEPPVKGRFAFTDNFTKLAISGGVDILGGVEQGSNGVYHIIELTENRMVLYSPLVPKQGTGWTWIFKKL